MRTCTVFPRASFRLQGRRRETAETRLEELGYEFISRTKARPDGAAQVFVLDPDGHIVELCSPPKSE
jgi:catechol 2,3-dioxygenase-like lactoylglutathione lyase family enzyme